MTTTIIFLRHADTQKNPEINAALWGLSEKGLAQAEEACQLPIMEGIEAIYVSEEQKTVLTVSPLIHRIGITPQSLAAFSEVKRGDKFLTKEEFETEKIKQLEDLSYHAFGGESGTEALTRFKKGVAQVTEENGGKKILIVTHGTVLNLYFADLLDTYGNLSDRWSKTAFCSYGIVEDGKVVKDII